MVSRAIVRDVQLHRRAGDLRQRGLKLLEQAEQLDALAGMQNRPSDVVLHEADLIEAGFLPGVRGCTLVGVADASYMIRRRRDRFFPATLFGEPAWDILLDLYIQGERGTPVSISSACLAGGTAPTTGLRWLSTLDELGLTERKPNASDGRMSWIRLTARGREQMQAYLADIAGEVEDWVRGVNDADADESELMAHAG